MELSEERTTRRHAESKQRKLQELLDVVREVLGDKAGTLTDEERERFQSALTNADQFKREEHEIEERCVSCMPSNVFLPFAGFELCVCTRNTV